MQKWIVKPNDPELLRMRADKTPHMQEYVEYVEMPKPRKRRDLEFYDNANQIHYNLRSLIKWANQSKI